jgi:hypothetical protein
MGGTGKTVSLSFGVTTQLIEAMAPKVTGAGVFKKPAAPKAEDGSDKADKAERAAPAEKAKK